MVARELRRNHIGTGAGFPIEAARASAASRRTHHNPFRGRPKSREVVLPGEGSPCVPERDPPHGDDRPGVEPDDELCSFEQRRRPAAVDALGDPPIVVGKGGRCRLRRVISCRSFERRADRVVVQREIVSVDAAEHAEQLQKNDWQVAYSSPILDTDDVDPLRLRGSHVAPRCGGGLGGGLGDVVRSAQPEHALYGNYCGRSSGLPLDAAACKPRVAPAPTPVQVVRPGKPFPHPSHDDCRRCVR